MNGIIHPCSHPENGEQPKSLPEMYRNVCVYLDRLVNVVRPRKTIFLAIDGVAPRAKMNQQRARRFRAAQEVREQEEVERKVREDLVKRGLKVPAKKTDKTWDSNVITPGTEFMKGLSAFVAFYVRSRISSKCKYWSSIKVIFSDASVPGEGEHKIMSFIRRMRCAPGYDPNIKHVLHGLDADLIMLGLATHEVNFFILREEVVFGRRGAEELKTMKENTGYNDKQKALDETDRLTGVAIDPAEKPLHILSLSVIREYLQFEFAQCASVPFKEVSFENIVDDFVFLCFFVGNDFLPHLPSLDIRDGGLDFLLNVYKRVLPSLGGYITSEGGKVNLKAVDVILSEVGRIEDLVFKMRHDSDVRDRRRRDDQKKRKKREKETIERQRLEAVALGRQASAQSKGAKGAASARSGTSEAVLSKTFEPPKLKVSKSDDNEMAAKELKAAIAGNVKVKVEAEKDKDKGAAADESGPSEMPAGEQADAGDVLEEALKEAREETLDRHSSSVVDKVKLHEEGWKDRYYSDKCKAEDIEGSGGKEELFKEYVKGLCWVMKYYYSGVASWKWYFPFHYAPFASDLRNIDRFEKDCNSWVIADPFEPIEQLLGVLPSDSAHAIPEQSRYLMCDLDSPIIDFYPKDVPCDPNGKAMPWLWVVLLPFIAESRLIDALKPTKARWTDKEHSMNARGAGDGFLFLHQEQPLAELARDVLKESEGSKRELGDASKWDTFSGTIACPAPEAICAPSEPLELPSKNIYAEEVAGEVHVNQAVSVVYSMPDALPHKSELLEGAKVADGVLQPHQLRIIRPRLNRGGNSIADMGGADDQAQQQHQAQGGRQWGLTEPQQKRQRGAGGNNFNSNPLQPFQSQPPQQQQQRMQMQMQMQTYGAMTGGMQPGGQMLAQPPPPPPTGYPQYGQHAGNQQFYAQQQNFGFGGGPGGPSMFSRGSGQIGVPPPPPNQQPGVGGGYSFAPGQQQQPPTYGLFDPHAYAPKEHQSRVGSSQVYPPEFDPHSIAPLNSASFAHYSSYQFKAGKTTKRPEAKRLPVDVMKSLKAQLKSTLRQQNRR